MKLNLLLVTSLITGAAFGQFTQTNEPAIGTSTTMYILDSNAVDYAAMTGAGQTWDYSMTAGIYGETKNVNVSTAAATTNGADYPSSTWAVDIPGFMTTYYTSSASSRVSQGFVFDGGDVAGVVRVVFAGGADDAVTMNYQYDLGENLTDAFAGEANTDLAPTPLATTGSIQTTVDGQGTLKLNAATTLTGVTRFKLHDQATADLPFGLGTVVMERTQYEYYDLANSSLPVFVHSTLVITMGGQPTTQHIVMSNAIPDGYLNVSENSIASFEMYPNPANESITVSGLSGNETISIVDMTGKTVLTAQNAGTAQTLNIADIQAGVYNVVVISNGSKAIKKLTIN